MGQDKNVDSSSLCCWYSSRQQQQQQQQPHKSYKSHKSYNWTVRIPTNVYWVTIIAHIRCWDCTLCRLVRELSRQQ